ncbi:MAG: response regulator [Pseudohongiellaceae bacterium]
MSNILIVDDSLSMRHMVSATLTQGSHDVVMAEDGQAGLNELLNESQKFDLIITDVNMPIMDGITFVKEIRQLSSYRFTPVLVLTTEGGPEKKLAGKEAGATGWVVKPFDPDRLITLVTRVLN